MKAIFFVVLACGWVIWMTVRYVASQAIARRRARFDPMAQLNHLTSEGQVQAWIDARRAAGWSEELIAQVLDDWCARQLNEIADGVVNNPVPPELLDDEPSPRAVRRPRGMY